MKNNIQLICFDMDDTLIQQNSWYKLNLALGVTHEEDERMYNQYQSGKLSYEEWTDALLELYKRHGKANKEYVTEILSKYELCDGARDIVDYLKNKGYELALISGSFDILVDQVADDLGITHRKGNTSLIFDESGMLVDLQTHGDEEAAKLRHLETFCEARQIPITQCACVGDGANDAEMFRKTEHGIIVNNTQHAEAAWKHMGSLQELKNIF